MAKTLQSLAGVGQDPEMALKIFQAMAESTQRSAPTQLPTQPQQHPDQSKLMAPEDLPFIERLFRGEEMPFDIGGPVKLSAKAARRLAQKIPRGATTTISSSIPGSSFGRDVAVGTNVPFEGVHGTFKGGVPDKAPKSFGGLHAGTPDAARMRVEYIRPSSHRQGRPGGQQFFPINATSKKSYGTPENPISETELASINAFPDEVQKLKNDGFDAIFYKNIVEDPGSISIQILDTGIINPRLAPGDITALLQLLKSGRFGALLDRAGVSVPTDRLRGVLRGNPTNPSKVDDLASQISREGQRDALSISVDKAGRPFIGEGNHRLDAIRQLGLPEAKISITPNVADDAQQFSAFLKALGL